MRDKKNKNRGRLLVVEDETEMRELLVEDLALVGANVTGAANGKEGLELLSKNHYHLILTDVRMPVMDGLTLMAKARAMGVLSPFIIITAFNEQRYSVEALRLGAVDFIEKPFQREDLHKRIRHWLKFGLEFEHFLNGVGGLEALTTDKRSKDLLLEIVKLRTINSQLKKAAG